MRLLISLLFLSTTLYPSAAQSIDSLFAAMPREALPVLDRSARLDLIDLYNSGLAARVENVFGGQTEMTSKDSSTVKLRTSDAGQWQMAIVRTQADTLLLTLHTLRAGGESTNLKVYNVRWQPSEKTVATPPFKEFWCPTVGLDPNLENVYRTAASQLPVRIEWEASERTLVYSLCCNALPEEQREPIGKCLCPVKQALSLSKQ